VSSVSLTKRNRSGHQQDGERLAACRTRQSRLELFHEERAVWKIGQRIRYASRGFRLAQAIASCMWLKVAANAPILPGRNRNANA